MVEGRVASTETDRCPICRQDSYLNPNLKFLVNDCYHKMCESCIDRIFTMGPAPCPICQRTLRKNKFRQQTFEDTLVEREVDLRKRIARTFNKAEEDFPTLKDYNDYLEEVENLTFNLVNKIDEERTEAKLAAYESMNKNSIAQNNVRATREAELRRQREKSDKEFREQVKTKALQEEADDARAKEEQRLDLIRALAASDGNASAIVKRNNEAALKRANARKKRAAAAEAEFESLPASLRFMNGAATAAHVEEDKEDDKPFNPLDNFELESSFYNVRTDYTDPLVAGMLKNKAALAGGFNAQDFYRRALCETFSSLHCFKAEAATG